MTWIGKILTVLVMLAAIVWMFLNAQSYATRTNWNAEANRYRDAYNAAIKARETDYRAGQAEVDNIKQQLVKVTKQRDEYASESKDKDDQINAAKKKYEELEEVNKTAIVNQNATNANLQAANDQVGKLRAQNDDLEAKRVVLVREREKANIEKNQAINERNGALTRAEQVTKERDELISENYVLRQNGGKDSNKVLQAISPRVGPLPENVRGTVTKVDGEFVELSIGLDAGLTPGATLDLSRFKPEPKYLGTLKVSAIIEPKRAVATFVPSSHRPMNQLRGDERPRVDDVVTKPVK